MISNIRYTIPPNNINTVLDRFKNDEAYSVAQDLVQRIREKQRNTILDRTYISYYQRKKFGKYCTCFANDFAEPREDCPVCFGTGKVGGYNKIGTELVVVSAADRFAAFNVVLDTTQKPFEFKLQDGYNYGMVDFEVYLPHISLAVDYFRMLSSNNEGTVTLLARMASSNTYTNFNDPKQFFGKCHLRVRLVRDNVNFISPTFRAIFIRFICFDKPLYVEMPRSTREGANSELFGLFDALTTVQLYMPNIGINPQVEDLIIDLRHNRKLKIIEVQENDPMNVVTSYDITARYVHAFEPIYGIF